MSASVEGFNNGRTIVPKVSRTGTLTLKRTESGTITAEEDMVVALNGKATENKFNFALGINNTGEYVYANTASAVDTYWMHFRNNNIISYCPEEYLRRFIVGTSDCPTCFVFLRKGDVLKITGKSVSPSATATATFYYYCYV